jgi:hypothetical protein
MEGHTVRKLAKPLRLAATPAPIEAAATPETAIGRGCRYCRLRNGGHSPFYILRRRSHLRQL